MLLKVAKHSNMTLNYNTVTFERQLIAGFAGCTYVRMSSNILCLYLQYLTEGFAGHLAEVQESPPRRAMFDVRQLLGDVCFSLPGKQRSLPVAGSKKRQSRSSLTPRTNTSQSNDSKHQVQSPSKQTTV